MVHHGLSWFVIILNIDLTHTQTHHVSKRQFFGNCQSDCCRGGTDMASNVWTSARRRGVISDDLSHIHRGLPWFSVKTAIFSWYLSGIPPVLCWNHLRIYSIDVVFFIFFFRWCLYYWSSQLKCPPWISSDPEGGWASAWNPARVQYGAHWHWGAPIDTAEIPADIVTQFWPMRLVSLAQVLEVLTKPQEVKASAGGKPTPRTRKSSSTHLKYLRSHRKWWKFEKHIGHLRLPSIVVSIYLVSFMPLSCLFFQLHVIKLKPTINHGPL